MVSGFDRYYQIVKCFRDEDLRADRQPEFTQIDIETSFLTESEIRALMEGLIRTLFKEVLDVALPDPFPVMSFAEAMARYGSDKPDLQGAARAHRTHRCHARRSSSRCSATAADMPGGRVAALRVPGAGDKLSRKDIDDYTDFVKIYGAKGLAYVKVNDASKPNEEGLQSPIVKFLKPDVLQSILERTGAQNGDLVFFGADKAKIVNDAMGALRQKIGHEHGYAVRRLAAAVGSGFPDVRVRRRGEALGGDAPSVHRARRTDTRTTSRPIPARRWPKPMT